MHRLLLVLLFLPLTALATGTSLPPERAAELAYLELLLGNEQQAQRLLPRPNPIQLATFRQDSDTERAPAVRFATTLFELGESRLAIEALELYSESQLDPGEANLMWLDIAGKFSNLQDMVSARVALQRIEGQLDAEHALRKKALDITVALEHLDTERASRMLETWPEDKAPIERLYLQGNLVSALSSLGRFDQAFGELARLRENLSHIPSNEESEALLQETTIRLGFDYIIRGQWEEAKSVLTNIPLASFRAHRGTLGLVWIDLAAGRFKEAVKPLQHLLENTPPYLLEHQEAQNLYAMSLGEMQLFGAAIKHYHKAIRHFEAQMTGMVETGRKTDWQKLVLLLTRDPDIVYDVERMNRLLGKPLHYALFQSLGEADLHARLRQQQKRLQLLESLHQNGANTGHTYPPEKGHQYRAALEKKIASTSQGIAGQLHRALSGYLKKLKSLKANADFGVALMYDRMAEQQYNQPPTGAHSTGKPD